MGLLERAHPVCSSWRNDGPSCRLVLVDTGKASPKARQLGRSVGPTTVPLDTERLLGESSANGTSRSSREKGTSSLDLTNILRGGQVASRKTILTNVFHPGTEL